MGMKKFHVLRIFIIITLLLSASLLGSCGEKPPEMPDFSQYVIIRSDLASAEETKVYVSLKKYFLEYAGLDLKLATDWESDSATAPEYEIIVGDANRSEYTEFCEKLKQPERSCAYGMIGNKLIFHAADAEGLQDIVDKFAADILEDEPALSLHDGAVYEYIVSEQLVRADGNEVTSEMKNTIMWGVNAHNKGYMAYSEALAAEHIRLAAELGSRIYRINYNPRNAEMVNYITKIAGLCHDYDMKIMLVLDDMSGSPDEIYERMSYMANELDGIIDYFQLFNETDIWCSRKDDGTFYNVTNWTGMTTDYYNPERVEICIDKMRAAISAFRENAPEAQLVVNIGSRHYPMLDWYVEAGLEWDIIAFDIYDLDVWDHHAFFRSMEKRYPNYQFMVAECNYPANSGEFTEEEQAAWLTDFLKIMDSYESERMIAVMIYELMDEPNFESDGVRNGEAHFGIVNTNPDFTIGKPKAAYREVQKLLCGGECKLEKVYENVK